MLEYDKGHGTALVNTLSQYLEVGGNCEATARALSTHRNTVKYRLRRIRTISGFDLANAGTRFDLLLATRALQTFTHSPDAANPRDRGVAAAGELRKLVRTVGGDWQRSSDEEGS